MKISLITVAFNSAKTIQDTIDSVLAQNYDDLEYIIVDGNSKDNTVQIIKANESKFNGKLKWISESDNGIYDAMNKGISMATGEVVGILNSDDMFYDKDALREIINSFDEDTDAVYANLIFVDQTNTQKIVREWKGSQYKPNAFTKGWHPAHPTFYVRKYIYEKYGYFNADFKIAADFDLMMRFIEKHQISTKYLDKNILRMRMGGTSTAGVSSVIISAKEIKIAFRNNSIKMPPFYICKRLISKIANVIKTKF